MISRILFIALDDYISVVSVSEKGKVRPIPFDGETVFKIQEDFWLSWCAQTAYIAPKNDKDNDATICDFCFVTDKDYPFAKDKFLDEVFMSQDTFWNVEKLTDIIGSLDILKKYQGISIKMSNGVCFDVVWNNNGKLINAVTNISDMDYKRKVEERNRLYEEKRKVKKKATLERQSEGKNVIEKNNNNDSDKPLVPSKEKIEKSIKKKKKSSYRNDGKESAIVKYNKKLIAEEEANK